VKDYLTVKEVARYLKKSESTIRRLIRGRKLRATKLAGKFGVYIIDRNDMLEYMISGSLLQTKSMIKKFDTKQVVRSKKLRKKK